MNFLQQLQRTQSSLRSIVEPTPKLIQQAPVGKFFIVPKYFDLSGCTNLKLIIGRWNSSVPVSQIFDAEVSSLGPWKAPPAGCIKINFDAAVPYSGARGGITAVCRDSTGLAMAWKRRKFVARTDVDTAELLAVKMGIELALKMEFTDVILEGDSLNVIQDIIHYSPSLAVNSNILAVVSTALQSFSSAKVAHVRQEANTLSHLLCHDFARDTVGFTELPFQFRELD